MRKLAAVPAVLMALSACGGSAFPSADQVARDWSAALNSGDNEAAAKLFAKDARIEQGSYALRFHTLAQAIHWNAALPCSGRITSVHTDGDTTTATFVLGPREDSPCDAPGASAAAQFTVRDGKIVLWRQLPDVGPPTV
jgi:limonene-1,2-epoxide hydrolase